MSSWYILISLLLNFGVPSRSGKYEEDMGVLGILGILQCVLLIISYTVITAVFTYSAPVMVHISVPLSELVSSLAPR